MLEQRFLPTLLVQSAGPLAMLALLGALSVCVLILLNRLAVGPMRRIAGLEIACARLALTWLVAASLFDLVLGDDRTALLAPAWAAMALVAQAVRSAPARGGDYLARSGTALCALSISVMLLSRWVHPFRLEPTKLDFAWCALAHVAWFLQFAVVLVKVVARRAPAPQRADP